MRHQLVGNREDRQNHRPADSEPAEQRVHDEQDGNVDRHPGRVEEGEEPVAGEKLAHVPQVVQGLRGRGAQAPEGTVEHRVEQPLVEQHVELGADPHQDPRAHQLKAPHYDEQHDEQEREQQKCRLAAAVQHAVVHLQHVDGGCQHQQVDEQAEEPREQERAAAQPQGLA